MTGPAPPREAPAGEPLAVIAAWVREAGAAGERAPDSVSFVTVGPQARPSARTVSLKAIDDRSLTFSSALWTRKVRELQANPHVALLFHWDAIGRQAHVTGTAVVGDRELARTLWSQRDLANQLQTIVSRQGEPISDVAPLRDRHRQLAAGPPPECPEDWGAIRVTPDTVELWFEADDRLHDRWLYEAEGGGWRLTRLAP